MLSEKDKIEAIMQIYHDRWCVPHDDGSDAKFADSFLKANDEIFLGSTIENGIRTLWRAKNISRLDHYGVSGRGLLTMMRNSTCAHAINTLGRPLGHVRPWAPLL